MLFSPFLHLFLLRKCRATSPLSKFCRSFGSAKSRKREIRASSAAAVDFVAAAAAVRVAPLGNFPLHFCQVAVLSLSRSFPPSDSYRAAEIVKDGEVTFEKELRYNYSYFKVRYLGTLVTSVTVTTINRWLKM